MDPHEMRHMRLEALTNSQGTALETAIHSQLTAHGRTLLNHSR